jgi:transmembrane sensor
MNVRLEYLYQRYVDNTCTEIEREEFLSMVAEKQEEKVISELLDGTWNTVNTADGQTFPAADSILDHILTQHPKTIVSKILWRRYAAVAAAILVVASAGIYFGLQYQKNNDKQAADYVSNIQAGKNRATLKLANGTIINLDSATNGEIAQQAGIAISKTEDGQLVYHIAENSKIEKAATATETFNTITTPRGGQYQINLPDGTKIWLNAGSSLKYPAVFSKDERKVELTGEAYFEVAKVTIKDKGSNKYQRAPFIVVTDKQKIEVLGTHFNVNSYVDNNESKTTLLEGSVKVSNLKSKRSNLLKPGQQSLIAGEGLQIANVDTVETVAWKNGYFQFNESDLEDIMKQLSRWYNVDVVFEGKLPEDLFHFKTPRNQSLIEVLKIFELNGINFKIEGRKLIVKS